MKKYVTINGEARVYDEKSRCYRRMSEKDRHEKAMADNKRRLELAEKLIIILSRKIALNIPGKGLRHYVVDDTKGYLGLDRQKLIGDIVHCLNTEEQAAFWEMEALLRPEPPRPPLPKVVYHPDQEFDLPF